MHPALHPAEDIFRAVATAVLPAEPADRELEAISGRIIDETLVARPVAVRRQIVAFLRLLEWIAFARHGTRLTRMSRDRRIAFLTSIQESRFQLLRRGFWGVRTLAMLGYYGRPTAAQQLGYRPHPDGWSARRPTGNTGTDSSERSSVERERTNSWAAAPERPADLAPAGEIPTLMAGSEPSFFDWVNAVPHVPLATPPSLQDLLPAALTPTLRGQSIGNRDEVLLVAEFLQEPSDAVTPEVPLDLVVATEPAVDAKSTKRSRKKKSKQRDGTSGAPAPNDGGGALDALPRIDASSEFRPNA